MRHQRVSQLTRGVEKIGGQKDNGVHGRGIIRRRQSEACRPPDCKKKQGEKGRQQIVKHDAKSALQSGIDNPDRWGFGDIKKRKRTNATSCVNQSVGRKASTSQNATTSSQTMAE